MSRVGAAVLFQDIELLTNAVEKERKNVERGVGGRERKQVWCGRREKRRFFAFF